MTVRPDCRGQSGTVAVAIVFVLALTSALLIAGIGSVTLEESQRFAETEKSVQVLTELDSKASLVALEGGDAASLDLGVRGDGAVEVSQTGRLRLIIRSNNTTTVLTNTSLGTVTYANGDQRVAYQGGGVWRRTAGSTGSVMVSPPEVHYEEGTLTLPMINITSDNSRLSTARIEKVDTTRIYPTGVANHSNPVPKGKELTMFVTSDYYRGWAAYFERRIGANTTVYDANRTVRVRLVSPRSRFKLGSGLISVGTGDRIEMSGNAGNPTFVDSYNSSRDRYPNSSTRNGTIRGAGGLKLGGNSFVKGTVNVGDEVTLKGQNNTVFGDVWHQGLTISGQGTITGMNASNGTGVSIPPIDNTVNARVNELCDEKPRPDFTAENGAGEYCIDGDLDFQHQPSDTLTFNLSEGNVSLAVTGDVDIGKDETIEVIHPSGNSVKLWLGGDEVDLNKGTVTVTDDRAPSFRLYGGSETVVDMQASSEFVGLIFAPGAPGSGGGLSMQSDSAIYGSAVVPRVRMQSGSAVHYDKALGGFSFNRRGTPAAEFSYFYVTINEVRITER